MILTHLLAFIVSYILNVFAQQPLNISITEIFIDDNYNRFWIEIINLGAEFNISSLEFTGSAPGNLLLGNVFDIGNLADDISIKQGDLFIIGNMQSVVNTPCDIYFDTNNHGKANCSNYINVSYGLTATRTSFVLSFNDITDNSMVMSPTQDNYFIIDAYYSYELSHIYADFTNLKNWRESCYKYGSP
eukprot:126288_1